MCLAGELGQLGHAVDSRPRQAKPFADHCLKLRDRLDAAFSEAKHAEASKGRRRTLDQLRAEYSERKTSEKRFDFFLTKYGVLLPSEPFELPIPGHLGKANQPTQRRAGNAGKSPSIHKRPRYLWDHWFRENPGKYWSERRRVTSISFRGLPQTYALSGKRKIWTEREALEFLLDACCVSEAYKQKSPPSSSCNKRFGAWRSG